MSNLTSQDAMHELLEHLDSLNVSEGVSLEIKNGLKKVFDGLVPKEIADLPPLPAVPTNQPVRTIDINIKLKIYAGSTDSPDARTIEIKKFLVYPGQIQDRFILSVNGVERNIEKRNLKPLIHTTMTLILCSCVEITANELTEILTMSKVLYLKNQEDKAQHILRYDEDETPEDFDFCPMDYDIDCYYQYIITVIQNILSFKI